LSTGFQKIIGGITMKIFETTVIAIGQDAEEFKQENMLLFFGEEAPPELSDFCYKIMVTPIQERIVPDMVLCFNNERYARKSTAAWSYYCQFRWCCNKRAARNYSC
jgi:hypothetical protein